MSDSEQTKHGFSMADVAAKPVTYRLALAAGRIIVGQEAFGLLRDKSLPKGDALALAEFAGIQAAKQTPSLIPLCHPISLNRVSIHTHLVKEAFAVDVYAVAEINARTGVEMEALCGLNIALLTIWDLTKPINAALEITDVKLLYKSGGKSGDWVNPEGLSAVAQSIVDKH
ncbi:MAG: cyclic pyranopterin monophosphate synthase MoaC [Lysobacterales bacterium]